MFVLVTVASPGCLLVPVAMMTMACFPFLAAQDYFTNMVPRIKATGIAGVIEFVQEPGASPYASTFSVLQWGSCARGCGARGMMSLLLWRLQARRCLCLAAGGTPC